MKLIIDIPDEVLKTRYYTDYFGCGSHKLTETLDNATPIPDNATNGDVIKAILSKYSFEMCEYVDESGISYKEIVDNTNHMSDGMRFDYGWWNAPYQKGGK